MIKAQIYRSSQRYFDCKILNSGEIVKATALGNILKYKDLVIGDYVELEQDPQSKEFQISKRTDRTSEVYRYNLRESKKKVTAANCTKLVIVSAVSKPSFKRGIIDRFLLRAVQWGLKPVVIFNKMDEYNPKKVDLKFEIDRIKNLGIHFVENSAKDKSFEPLFGSQSLDEFAEDAKSDLTLFVGQSGVGKSTVINQMTGNEYSLLTKDINKSGKGSHTTTWSEIVETKKLNLIDTPGIRSFSLDDLIPEDLLSLFPDIQDMSLKCQFSNCGHDEKSSGCSFNQLPSGAYETKLIKSRLESYLQILESIAENKAWEKK